MEQRIVHGAMLDVMTPDEFLRMIPRPEQVTRIREPAQIVLDAAGSGQVEVYKVPMGYRFAVRRVTLAFGDSDPFTGVTLGVGKYVVYQRSGTRIEHGAPQLGPNLQVPGVQTWGDQQGPALENGEVFQVKAVGLAAAASLVLIATVEGMLVRPKAEEMTRAQG